MYKVKVFTFEKKTTPQSIEEQINGWLGGLAMVEFIQITTIDPCKVMVCYKLREMKGYI